MKKWIDWAKQNPALAGFAGIGAVFVVVMIVVIIALLSGPKAPDKKQIELAESEKNLCARIKRLASLEGDDQGKMSGAYVAALKKAYHDLTHDDAGPEDVLVLSRQSGTCNALSNDDLAWRVQAETRVRRGMWPAHPVAPPASPEVANEVRDAIQSARLKLKLAADQRDAWLKLAVAGKDEKSALLAEFYTSEAPQADQLLLYNKLVAMPEGAWLAQKIYDKLSFLPEAIVVRDDKGETLQFLGTLEADHCALAGADKTINVRPCTGLTPLRLQRGNLVLLGATAAQDLETPAHWLPVLIDDKGEVQLGANLSLDPRVLGAFVSAASRYQLGPKGLYAFSPQPSVAEAHEGDKGFASFRTQSSGKPTMLAFDDKLGVAIAKKCAKLEPKRCAPVVGDNPEHRCTTDAPICYMLPGGTEVRATSATIVRPDPCMKEYGEKTECPSEISAGLFVDVRRNDAPAFVSGNFIELHKIRKE